MMGEIKAIETVYNGYRFRSRLEARWAVFFDAVGIKYQYEPEGFERFGFSEDGSDSIKYLPDFYLQDSGIYCEVKPNRDKLMEDGWKLSWMVDFDGPMSNGLLILGQIPMVNDGDFPIFIMFHNYKGLVAEPITITGEGVILDTCLDLLGNKLENNYCSAPEFCYPEGTANYYRGSWDDLCVVRSDFPTVFNKHIWHLDWREIPINAYKLARQARFEHGESPKIGGYKP